VEQIRGTLAGERPESGDDFRAAFRKVALFLGRPGSETVLFSGVPFDDGNIQLEDVTRLSERIGLEFTEHSRKELAAGNVDLPVLVICRDGSAVALLEADAGGGYSTEVGRPGATTRSEVLHRDIAHILSFSIVYSNSQIEPGVGDAQKIERRHWLWGTLTPFWRSYVQVAVAALFINLLALASPLFVMNVYDRVLPNEAIATLWVLAIGVSLAILFDLLLKTVRAALIDYAGRKADLKLSYLLFEKVLNSSLASRPASTGEYASRVTQYEFVREFFTSNTLSTLIDTVFVFIFIAVIYSLSGWLAIFPALAFLAALTIGLVAQYRIGRRVAAASNESAQRQALLIETISTIETVKSLSAERPLLRRWHELAKKASHTSEQIKQLSSGAANATQFVQQLVTVGVIIGGAYQFSEGNMSSGAIIASVMLSGRTVAPLGQIAMTLARFRQAMLSLKILNSIMEQPEDRPDTVGFVNREIGNSSVSFRNVEFVYPGTDHKVINGLSFSVAPGERVGIIGRIGSGKTTIGRLLGGLYPPSGGTLSIDGVDIRQYHPAVVRAAVAVASQSADLFSGTVKENLLLGRPDATDEELLAVARLTGVDDFASRHPRGYDMPVGERGSNLSGGQRQAVAIARLLLAKPRIVFLDEPSGAMDLATEKILIRNLAKSFDAATTLIISTHRYSMLELVDRLIVVDQGRVVADGPKKNVIEELQRKAIAQN
jgi:ATP-binding cassette, subfamily C, bacterial LapB